MLRQRQRARIPNDGERRALVRLPGSACLRGKGLRAKDAGCSDGFAEIGNLGGCWSVDDPKTR